MVRSNIFFKCFKSCSPPSTTRHHLPHYSLIIMVLTRRSIISQPNRLYTRSRSPLVPVLFSLSENNINSYYSIDRCSGFRRVCLDCTIFFLFHIYLVMSNLFRIIDRYCFHLFPLFILWFNSLIPRGVTRLCKLRNYGVIIKSKYSSLIRQPSPLHTGF
jgi:hypothetical protein